MTAVPPTGPSALSPREEEVLDRIAQGQTNAEIAQALGLSFATVKAYVSSILTKLGVERREEAAVWWQHHGHPSRPSVFARWLRALVPLGALKTIGVAAGGVTTLAVGAGVLALAVTAWPSSPDGGGETVHGASDGFAAEDCTLPGEPAEMVNRTVRQVDIDGDGQADEAAVYAVPSESKWVLRVELAAGGGFEQALDVASLPVEPGSTVAPREWVYPAGGHDLDADGSEELVLVQSRGAAASAGLFVKEGCAMRPATLAGEPASFPLAATPAEYAGVRCRDGRFLRFAGTSSDGITYEVETIPLTLTGGELEEGTATTEIMHLAAVLPVLLDCPGLTRDPYGSAPEPGEYVVSLRPEHRGIIAAEDTALPNPEEPTGICAEVWFADLPTDITLLRRVEMALDGRDVPASRLAVITQGDGRSVFVCYHPESAGGWLAPGFHTATVTIRDPEDPAAPPRQVVTWAFDVVPAELR